MLIIILLLLLLLLLPLVILVMMMMMIITILLVMMIIINTPTRQVPYLLLCAELITSIGAGMTVKFFMLWRRALLQGIYIYICIYSCW